MKNSKQRSSLKNFWSFLLASLLCFSISNAQDLKSLIEIKGEVTSADSRKSIPKATITLIGTNLSTVTNGEGTFALKIPKTAVGKKIIVSAIGFTEKSILIPKDTSKPLKITLDYSAINLDTANLVGYKDAKTLVKNAFKKREENYINTKTIMTAFYRETIKKRNKNASLAEAVVSIYKQPYNTNSKDRIKLVKSRKDIDYSKLDTITLKLQGGPFSTLYGDLMKYPEYLFNSKSLEAYTFNFGKITEIKGENVYVVHFKQRDDIITPLYEGKLYIASGTLALIKASYALRLTNTKEVIDMFIRRKPLDVKVKPRNVSYEVNYREKDGQWIYGYSRVNLSFEVKKKRRLFKSIYTLSCEMATTDWEEAPIEDDWNNDNEISKYIIMANENMGFRDPAFWGEYNVIEPEKSIESAIKKIKRKLARDEQRSTLGKR